jgi:uncharacterized protein (DUF2336 family)
VFPQEIADQPAERVNSLTIFDPKGIVRRTVEVHNRRISNPREEQRPMLTHDHLRALRDNPSSTIRANIAIALAADLVADALTGEERQIAEQILDALAHDLDRRVRQALAEHVKECPFLPGEIASTLASDIEDMVALPMIQHSPLLSDTDLILCVRAGSTSRRLAVARRPRVAPIVVGELVETGDPDVVGAVLANAGADVSEHSLLKVAVRYQGDESIAALLVERPALPLTVCEVLIACVSKRLRERLLVKHQIPGFLADELVMHAREKALTEILPCSDAEGAERLAYHLQARRRLTPTLLLRSLCVGDLSFFDSAIATLAGVPAMNARALLYDRGILGLRAIYQKAGLPPALFKAFRVAMGAVLDGYLNRGRAAYTQRVIDQLVLVYNDLSPAGLEGVLAQLSAQVSGGGTIEAEVRAA